MFFDNFCYLCKRKGQSPSKTGMNIGLCNATTCGWKKNGTIPKQHVLDDLAKELDCCVADFFLGEEELRMKYSKKQKSKTEENINKHRSLSLSSDEEELVRLFRQVAKNRRDELLFMSEVYALAERMGYDNNKKQKA